ncbi:methyltransferase [Plakobranchus ocellatus]|uniref:Methyltransferase n=1 Tax=Plakobranchus ocellatus TaxID=259542 RepID=A0AAV4BWQ5_9GAST|nr:methyltransferase [Plakobranchus ocellatus]
MNSRAETRSQRQSFKSYPQLFFKALRTLQSFLKEFQLIDWTNNHKAPHQIAPLPIAPDRSAPHQIAPYRIALYRSALHRTAPHRTAPHRTVLHSKRIKLLS